MSDLINKDFIIVEPVDTLEQVRVFEDLLTDIDEEFLQLAEQTSIMSAYLESLVMESTDNISESETSKLLPELTKAIIEMMHVLTKNNSPFLKDMISFAKFVIDNSSNVISNNLSSNEIIDLSIKSLIINVIALIPTTDSLGNVSTLQASQKINEFLDEMKGEGALDIEETAIRMVVDFARKAEVGSNDFNRLNIPQNEEMELSRAIAITKRIIKENSTYYQPIAKELKLFVELLLKKLIDLHENYSNKLGVSAYLISVLNSSQEDGRGEIPAWGEA
ncbi:MAG: hypothetical protein ACMG57_05340 [Candidatus Dojkabacteria bacterium]